MTTVTIERERIREACEHARDELGFDMCVDIVATDYLDWGGKGVSGYIGTASGRDIMHPTTQGLQALPELEAEALLDQLPPARAAAGRRRACACSAGLDDGERVPSVVSVWPTCDWHEREQFDLMGIVFDGHPNLERLLMPEDWEGPPAAQGLSARRRARPLLGRRMTIAPIATRRSWPIVADGQYEGSRIPSRVPTILDVPAELRDSEDVLQVNFGPNHPSTHGVLRLIVDLARRAGRRRSTP